MQDRTYTFPTCQPSPPRRAGTQIDDDRIRPRGLSAAAGRFQTSARRGFRKKVDICGGLSSLKKPTSFLPSYVFASRRILTSFPRDVERPIMLPAGRARTRLTERMRVARTCLRRRTWASVFWLPHGFWAGMIVAPAPPSTPAGLFLLDRGRTLPTIAMYIQGEFGSIVAV